MEKLKPSDVIEKEVYDQWSEILKSGQHEKIVDIGSIKFVLLMENHNSSLYFQQKDTLIVITEDGRVYFSLKGALDFYNSGMDVKNSNMELTRISNVRVDDIKIGTVKEDKKAYDDFCYSAGKDSTAVFAYDKEQSRFIKLLAFGEDHKFGLLYTNHRMQADKVISRCEDSRCETYMTNMSI